MEEKGTRKKKGENTGNNDYKLGKNEERDGWKEGLVERKKEEAGK